MLENLEAGSRVFFETLRDFADQDFIIDALESEHFRIRLSRALGYTKKQVKAYRNNIKWSMSEYLDEFHEPK